MKVIIFASMLATSFLGGIFASDVFASEIINIKETSYGARIEIRFDREIHYQAPIFAMAYRARWSQKSSCRTVNHRLHADVSLTRERICRGGDCQAEAQTTATRKFNIRKDELCENGTADVVFVNGVKVI